MHPAPIGALKFQFSIKPQKAARWACAAFCGFIFNYKQEEGLTRNKYIKTLGKY
jgi:hypothetical protein